MLMGMVVLVAVTAAPKIAVSSFTCSADIAPTLCESYERRFTDRLSRSEEVQVISQRDVEVALGLERQKQLLGCADDDGTSCLAELSNALGVDGVLTGLVTRTRSGFLLSLKVVRAGGGAQWVTASERARTEKELQDALDAHARRFLFKLTGKTQVGLMRPVSLGVAVAGAAMIGIGAGLYSAAKGKEALLRSDTPQTGPDIEATAAAGSTLQSSGVALITLGIPIFITGALLALINPGSDEFSFAPMVTPHGAYVGFGGTW